jgi:hypothetical protein
MESRAGEVAEEREEAHRPVRSARKQQDEG